MQTCAYYYRIVKNYCLGLFGVANEHIPVVMAMVVAG